MMIDEMKKKPRWKMGECIVMSGQVQTFKVVYVRNKPSLSFKHGVQYDAYLPVDNQSGSVYALKSFDGKDCAYPASWFKRTGERTDELMAYFNELSFASGYYQIDSNGIVHLSERHRLKSEKSSGRNGHNFAARSLRIKKPGEILHNIRFCPLRSQNRIFRNTENSRSDLFEAVFLFLNSEVSSLKERFSL